MYLTPNPLGTIIKGLFKVSHQVHVKGEGRNHVLCINCNIGNCWVLEIQGEIRLSTCPLEFPF